MLSRAFRVARSTVGGVSTPGSRTVFPPCRLGRRLPRLGTMKALTPAPLHRRCRSPRLSRTTFRTFRPQPLDAPVHRFAFVSNAGQPFAACTVCFKLRPTQAGSPSHPAVSGSLSYGPFVRLAWLPTPPRGDAVTFGYGVMACSGTDLHRAGRAPSRAYLGVATLTANLRKTEQPFGAIRWRDCATRTGFRMHQNDEFWRFVSFFNNLVKSSDHHGSLISTKRSPDLSSAKAWGKARTRSWRRCALLVLPQVNQITCGGGPKRSSKCTKSLSLVSTVAFAFLAASNISWSAASRIPNSRTAAAGMSKVCVTQEASAGES